ncbi:NAD(P)/FAD-dependent oxidoreductase [Dinghuibacter silviterrae]|uniref:NADH:ubiquinone reductase (non-electrogenic) n=1 Tax=Dinghuibacter silviterrae TaxID=1539049 RepID=A0A4R8DT47_9BACT|nr:NAD(P)/FAD-dependent oxidoreductase [Dinghuibacter silviterrae]TDX01068.1 NADH dehydrogenase [Dinghuibacter silviterrae]
MEEPKHLVIVGGGFAGLKLARSLSNHPAYRITLIDRHNFHQFQPLFYQVATASLEASSISFPLRKTFQGSRNVRIRIAELFSVDAGRSTIQTSAGPIAYDYLVLAMGADTNYFGNKDVQQYAFPMKTTMEAMALRNRIVENLEAAASAPDEATRQRHLNVVVVGGGPTGVELSGAIAEMKRFILPKDYPELDLSKMHIYLVENSPYVLNAMSPAAKEKARAYLTRMGVEVMTGTAVKDYDGTQAILKDGSSIPTALVIWAAGVRGNVPKGISPDDVTPQNRIRVDATGRIASGENIFVLGDLSYQENAEFPKGMPQLANIAIAQAAFMAGNFKRLAKGKAFEPFHFKFQGSMATVGRNKAVVDLNSPKISFQGLFAWLVWMSVHLFLLMGFKNRLLVFINWAYKYVTFDNSLRLIYTRPPYPIQVEETEAVS